MREVTWSTDAVEQLLEIARSDPRQANRIREGVVRFSRDEARDIKKLRGVSNEWRLRLGDWRIRFEERPGGQTVLIAVTNRRDAYDDD